MLGRALKSAVVGLGVGRQHALALLKDPRTELCAIVEHDEVRAQDFVQNYKDQNIQISTFNEVVGCDEIDLISLASFDGDHFHQVMAGLKHSKHMFVEKPLCQTRPELEDIYALWKTSSCALASNLVLRKAPLYIWLKDLISSGALGDIYAFDGDYLYGRVHKIMSGWRSETENYSVMEGGGIHIIDLMLMLTGQKPSEVYSLSNKIATRNTDFQYHDFQSSQFMFESGLIGRVTANFGCIHRHHHVIRVFGTKGTFLYDDAGPRIHWTSDEDKTADFVKEAPLPAEKGVLIPDFIGTIINNDIIESAYQEFDLMSVVLAADEVLNCKKPTRIEYLTC
ncbi:MAG: hypothetical protein COB14_09085 [Alphaproteobacteria bacterium]|nr:MAG: hypothetical protein COB14_09085 [Alphaproteobacteria bacterium]